MSVRITSKFCHLAAVPLLALLVGIGGYGGANAQTEQPAKSQFGPRLKPGQGKPAGAPAAEVVATHGAWKVQCEVAQQASAAQAQPAVPRQCGMVQIVQNEKNPKVFMNLVVVRAKQGDQINTSMRMIVPVGVYLPQGVALQIGDAAIGRVGYVRCTPQICMANGEVKPETLDKFKKGSAATFIIYEAPGIGLPMNISLDGFSAALAELDKL